MDSDRIRRCRRDFDLDGTLIDTAGDLAASMNDVLAKNGREILDPSEVRGMVGRGARAILEGGVCAHWRAC